MIEEILSCATETDYDFRQHTSAKDPLNYLFPDWVKYYQLKYAIAKVIQPDTILEIGVRFGYSAITFLEASPKAHFTGIDIDNEEYGGEKGAIDWAKKITRDYQADYIISDTTRMDSFPGKFYDLIHVDAQQDGDGTFSDLEKALEKGRYILVDGYFWSKLNMLSSTYFLEKYKDFIEYALIIPGYAGELLIKTRSDARNMFNRYTNAYETLVGTYDSHYYLNDCGGYDAFLKTDGEEIVDPRLLAAIYLARTDNTKSILDIGSGRGELAYALSKQSSYVIGLDYSSDAIDIAQKTYKNVEGLDFVQADILKFNTDRRFDVILATDVVEHIEAEKLQKMFEKVKTLLSREGVFIVHTAPNKLNYIYEYAKKYKLATEIGAYIPKNPRTYYEDMMHINEQTPAMLNRELKKCFDYVFVWTANAADIFGDFNSPPNKQVLKSNDSIYAICSNERISKKQVEARIAQKTLNCALLNVKMDILSIVEEVSINECFTAQVDIHNLSEERFVSLLPFPIHVSYHWKEEKTGEYVIYDGLRTPFKVPLLEHTSRQMEIEITAPQIPGTYILELTMVQEEQFWFESVLDEFPVKRVIRVFGV